MYEYNKEIEDQNIIDDLLDEFKEHRNSLLEMIKEMEKLKETIEDLFPKNLDKRYLMYFQEKIKAMTGIFSTLLDMRKEISKSLKDEIDLRRKISSKNNDEDIDDILDIKSIADKIKNFNQEKEKREKNVNKILEKNKKESSSMVKIEGNIK
jgi:hypothetical protein